VIGGGRDEDQVALADLLGVAGDRHRAAAADDDVDLLGLLVRAQRLLGAGRDLEPGNRHVARAEFAGVHEDVRSGAVPLLDGASASRLTSIGALSTRNRPANRENSANHQVDQLAGHDDLLDDLLAVEVAAHLLALAGQRQQLVLGASAPPRSVAQLAVDLDDRVTVSLRSSAGSAGQGCSQTAAASPPDLAPRCGARREISERPVRREAQRGPPRVAVEAVLEPVASLTSSITRDRGVELEAASKSRSPCRSPSAPWRAARGLPRAAPRLARLALDLLAERQSRERKRLTALDPSSVQSPPRSGGPMKQT
jgi:hypothetical protein